MDHEQYMRMALELAREASSEGEVPVGCVIADENGKVIGRGRNRREEKADATAHAEIEAIREAGDALGSWRLDGCTLYVTLEPCPMCAAALNWAQVGRIVYGAPDPRRGCTLYSPSLLHPRTEVVSGILADDCAAMMRDYFQSLRK